MNHSLLIARWCVWLFDLYCDFWYICEFYKLVVWGLSIYVINVVRYFDFIKYCKKNDYDLDLGSLFAFPGEFVFARYSIC